MWRLSNSERATPDVHRTPSPTDISLTVNPLAAPYSRASAGSSGCVLSAITAGPAPDSTAATPQRRRIRRYSADAGMAGGPLRLMQHVLGRLHQQVGPLGQRHDQQRRAAHVEPGVGVADLLREAAPGSRPSTSVPRESRGTGGCRGAAAAAPRRSAGCAPSSSVQDTTAPPRTAAAALSGCPSNSEDSWISSRLGQWRRTGLCDKAIDGGKPADHRGRRRAQSARVRNVVAAAHDQARRGDAGRGQPPFDGPHDQMRTSPAEPDRRPRPRPRR